MSRRIWVARHALRQDFVDAEWPLRSARPLDPPLSAAGRVQASELGTHFRDKGITRIFASPFLRTIETAAYVAKELHLPIHIEPGLGEALPELDRDPELMSPIERGRRFHRIAQNYRPVARLHYPESEHAARTRAALTLVTLAEYYRSDDFLCVTHASPLVGIIRTLCSPSAAVHAPLCCAYALSNDSGWKVLHGPDISFLSDTEMSLRHDYFG